MADRRLRLWKGGEFSSLVTLVRRRPAQGARWSWGPSWQGVAGGEQSGVAPTRHLYGRGFGVLLRPVRAPTSRCWRPSGRVLGRSSRGIAWPVAILAAAQVSREPNRGPGSCRIGRCWSRAWRWATVGGSCPGASAVDLRGRCPSGVAARARDREDSGRWSLRVAGGVWATATWSRELPRSAGRASCLELAPVPGRVAARSWLSCCT